MKRPPILAAASFFYSGLSDSLLNIPHKGTETETLGLFVDTVQFFEERVYLLVAYYSEDGRAHGGPCVTAVVGLASLAATSLYLGEHGESTTVEVVEREEYLLLVCLVVGDKYGFHVFYLLFTNLLFTIYVQFGDLAIYWDYAQIIK